MVSQKNKYKRWVRFIRQVIIDSGCVKSSGEPNVTAFYDKYSGCFKGTGLTLGKSNFAGQVRGPDHEPYGTTLAALALLLSTAKGEVISVAMLDGLIERDGFDKFSETLEDSKLPTELEAEETVASTLLTDVLSLSLNARSTIAPKLLFQLAKDWEYLDLPEPRRIARLLQEELRMRGIGLEVYAKSVLGGTVPLKTLRAIYTGQAPDPPLKIDQVIRLQENLRSIDGDTLDLAELSCLMNHLDLPR
jgi:hypothetical protein